MHAKSLQSCLTHCDPLKCSAPGCSVHGILQAGILEWLPFPTPGDLPNPGIEPTSPLSLVLVGRFFTTSTTWKAHILYQFSSVQSFSRVQLFATSWTAAHQASLSITISWSLLELMSIKSVIPSNHLILCCPLLL